MVDHAPMNREATPQVESSGGNRGNSGANTGAQRSGSTGGEMKQQMGQVADQARERAGQMTDQVKEQAAHMKDKATETATDKLEGQKTRATSSLGDVSDAIRQTGEQFRSNDQDAIAQYIDRAAEQVDQVTGYLRNRDMRQIVGDVEAFARREPTLFIGGAFVLGLLGARFLKSSSQANNAQDTDGQRRQGRGTQEALSSYSSYASMPQTQPIPTREEETAPVAPTSGGTSYPTPTAGGGMSGLGTGGSVTPSRATGSSVGSTSAGTGAPDWQGGDTDATHSARPTERIRGSEQRDTTGGGSTAREGREGNHPTNTRSGGDAGA